MKLTKTILFLIILSSNVSAQWFWQNPLPQGNRLYDICFVDSLYGYAVGIGSTLLKTSNGGETWENIFGQSDELFLNTSFINRTTGWILTYPSYIILKTTNGGNSWDSLSSLPMNFCFDIDFVNDSTGYIVGGTAGNGIVAVTSNGGISWNQNIGTTTFGYFLSSHFLNQNVGWACGVGVVVRTTDGGQTWTEKFPPCDPLYGCPSLVKIYSLSEQNAYVVGDIYNQDSSVGYFAKTSSGGNSWLYKIFQQPLTDIYFASEDTGWVASKDGSIYFTSDGGITWNQFDRQAYIFTFANKTNAWGIIDISQITKTKNGWQSSEVQTSAITTNILWTVASIDTNYVVAAGDNSIVVATTDGGSNWNIINSPNQSSSLNDIFCREPLEIFSISSYGDVLHSTDWGSNWTNIDLGNVWLNCISFVNQDTGFITGTNFFEGLVYRTTDGGLSWNVYLTFNEIINIGKIKFYGQGLGWLIAENQLFHTTDYGSNWKSIYSGPLSFYDLEAIDDNAWFTWANQVTFTNDGGNTWNTHEVCPFNPYEPNNARSITFINKNNGWIVTDIGEIYKTANGGVTWLLDTDMNQNSLFSICQANSNKLWTVGIGGTILFYNASPSSVSTIQGNTYDFHLSQNYPNPFNPTTIIKWQLPVNSFVILKVYDILGREVATLVNEEKPAGSYENEFNASNLSTGIYFYHLQAGDYLETKKMILIK